MQRVVEHNESVQARAMGFQASYSQRRAEAGAFEPAFVASGEYEDIERPNTIEIERSLNTGGEYFAENHNFSTAIELRTPLGTRMRFGAIGNRLSNNVQRTVFVQLDAEYESSVGVSIEQPLLKGAGFRANLATLRMAARRSDISFHEYRKEFMDVIAQAELAYWNLYYAQQETRLSEESVALARTLVTDSEANLDAGRGTSLDLMEAEAGLALRLSRASQSEQNQVEAMNILASYFGGRPREMGMEIVALEEPVSRSVDVSFEKGLEMAMAMNPDLQRVRAQRSQELIRLGYAKNQRLPQVDLSASAGASGLGFDWDTSLEDLEELNYPNWTVGLIVRIPIWGGVRERHEFQAARVRLMQMERVESNVMTQLRTEQDTAQQRVDASFTAARRFADVVEFRMKLLEARMQSQNVGRMGSRSVLEAEQELFATRLEQLQSEIDYQRALLQLQLITGSLLQSRGLEMSMDELAERTGGLVRKRKEPEPLTYRSPDTSRLLDFDPVVFESDERSLKTPWIGIGRK